MVGFLNLCVRVSGPCKGAERRAAELEGECESRENSRELSEGRDGEPEPRATEEPEDPEQTAERER